MKTLSAAIPLLAISQASGLPSNRAATKSVQADSLAFIQPIQPGRASQISGRSTSLIDVASARPEKGSLVRPFSDYRLGSARVPSALTMTKKDQEPEPNTVERFCERAQQQFQDALGKIASLIKNPMDLWLDQASARSGVERVDNSVMQTALTVAALKVAAGALKDDPITQKLVGDELLMAMKFIVSFNPNFFKELGVVSRSPWIDNKISQLCREQGIDQLIVLAAGLDTRAYRLPDLNGVCVFELDLPPMVEAKNRLFQEIEEDQNDSVSLQAKSLERIPGDLLDPNWKDSIIAAGFDPEKPSVILQEGILYYFLPEEAKSITLGIQSLAAPGSHLLLDCMNAEAIKNYPFDKLPGQEPIFHTAIENPEEWFKEAGFDHVDIDHVKQFFLVDASVK